MMKKTICLFVALLTLCLQINQVQATTQLEDGYVVYHIDESCIDEEGKIIIDGNKLSEALLNKAWSQKPGSHWMPGQTSVGKVKFINDLPYDIELKAYTVKIPEYTNVEALKPTETLRTSLPYSGSTGLNARGKDGNIIPIGLNCFRCANEAITALYEKKANQITLEDLMHVEKKIEEVYGQKMSYAKYLCQYYHVNNLDELTDKQKKAILDGNVFYTTKIGDPSILLEKETLTYACSENNGSIYLVHEFDKEVIELGYNYYFDTLMTFSFDESLEKLSDKTSYDYTILNYLNPTSKVSRELNQFLVGKTILSQQSLTFESLQYHINGPLMGNAYSNREVPSFLSFEFEFQPVALQGYAFQDNNNNGYLDENDVRLSEVKMNLWQGNNLIETTQTDKNGFYQFENKREGDTYTITTEILEQYTLTKLSQNIYGNVFRENDEGKAQYGEFQVSKQKLYYNVGFVEKTYQVFYNANGGKGEQTDKKNPYHYQEKVTVLDCGNIHREGYSFKEWNTKADGTGQHYIEQESFEMPRYDVTLYAIWQKDITVTPVPSNPTPTQKEVSSVHYVDTSDETRMLIFILLSLSSFSGIIITKALKKKYM